MYMVHTVHCTPNRDLQSHVVCPVSSKTMTDVYIVCVTPPAIAAAPTTAYPPGLMSRPLILLIKAVYYLTNHTTKCSTLRERERDSELKQYGKMEATLIWTCMNSIKDGLWFAMKHHNYMYM